LVRLRIVPLPWLCRSCCAAHVDLPSFPTRRSSDLSAAAQRLSRIGGGANQPISGSASRFSVLQRRWANCTLSHVCVPPRDRGMRSEEHTSELQSRENLVCRLPLEKTTTTTTPSPPP